MKLISSGEAVDFLAQAAPRPWVHRLLRWMAFDERLIAYSSSGIVQPHTNVMRVTQELIDEAGETAGPKMDTAIRANFSEDLATKLVGKDSFDRFNDEPTTWDETEDPLILDIGFFLYASEIDFEKGTLEAEFLPDDGVLAEIFFESNQFLGTEIDGAEFEAKISGLSFEYSMIELHWTCTGLVPVT